MIISELINNMALKAGIKSDDADLKQLLSSPDLLKITVPESISAAMQSGLHTLDSAAANPELKDKMRTQMKAEILNGVDAELDRAVIDLGIGDDVKALLKAEPNTGKRAALLATKVKELESKKTKTSPEAEKLVEEINTLKKSLGETSKTYEAQLADLKNQHENQLTDYEKRNLLSQYNYALGDVDNDIKIDTAQGLLNRKLQETGAKLVRVNGRLEIVSEKDGSKVFDKSNTEVTLKSFMDSAVSGIIKKSEPAPPGPANPTFTPSGNGNNAVNANYSALEALDNSLKVFESQ